MKTARGYIDLIGLCQLAYESSGRSKGEYRIAGRPGWHIAEIYSSWSFRAILVKSPSRQRILSFAGSDDSGDWLDNIMYGLTGMSRQHYIAVKLASRLRPSIVVGHSLGGGLASFVASYNRLPAFTINPAPLHIKTGLTREILENVTNYVVPGEALDILDFIAIKHRRVGRIVHVGSRGGNPIGKHLLKNLVGFSEPKRV